MSAKPARTVPSLEDLADELGALEQEMARHAPKIQRIELLKRSFREACPAKLGEEWTVHGKRFTVALGACATQRSINFPKLVAAIGAKVFAAFATCTLKALEEHVPPPVIAAVVTSGPTGPRPLKTFERSAA